MTRAPAGTFCWGSTPGVEPGRQPPASPFLGNREPGKVPASLLQPSFSNPRNELFHLNVKAGRLTATRYALRLEKCARLTVYNVMPSGEMTGPTLTPGRCEPQLTMGG